MKIQSKLPIVSIDEIDQPVWSISKKALYTCAETWELIRYNLPQVDWWNIIWFSMHFVSSAEVVLRGENIYFSNVGLVKGFGR